MATEKTWREKWTEAGYKRIATKDFSGETFKYIEPNVEIKAGDVFWYYNSNMFDSIIYRTDEEKPRYFRQWFFPEVFEDFKKG